MKGFTAVKKSPSSNSISMWTLWAVSVPGFPFWQIWIRTVRSYTIYSWSKTVKCLLASKLLLKSHFEKSLFIVLFLSIFIRSFFQVYVLNSSNGGTFPAPFGYLKAATNLQCVNLFIMPYNYPVLLSLIDEVKQDSKVKLSQLWRLKLEKYLMNVPNYYIQVSHLFYMFFSLAG